MASKTLAAPNVVRIDVDARSTASSVRHALAAKLGLTEEDTLPAIAEALLRFATPPVVLVGQFDALAKESVQEMRAVSALLRELARLVAVQGGAVVVAANGLTPR